MWFFYDFVVTHGSCLRVPQMYILFRCRWLIVPNCAADARAIRPYKIIGITILARPDPVVARMCKK